MTRNARVVWQDDCDYIPLRDKRLDDIDNCEIPLVSANFVIPYPPGFPILVPGQQLSQAIIDFFRHLVRSFFLHLSYDCHPVFRVLNIPLPLLCLW
jgi:hypothetical protein